MYQEDAGGLQSTACDGLEPKLTLLIAGEIDSPEAQELQKHIQSCAGCRAAFEREGQLLALLGANRPEPDAALLGSCRAELFDSLDQQEERGWLQRVAGSLLPSSWVSPQPAWSAALLLVIGFAVGLFGPRLLHRHPGAEGPNQGSGSLSAAQPFDVNSAGTSTSNSAITSLDLHPADVASINVFPADGNAAPQVQLQLNTQRAMTLSGTVYDDSVKSALIHVLQDSQRNDPDVRLDAVDLLRILNNDPAVRSALCRAAHTDHNAAVRLKAVEALDGAEPQPLIRQTLLDALVDDQNPGVRVEAMNELRDLAAKGQVESDEQLLAILQERARKDPSTYIRLQSAAVLRDLAPRQKF
jgi:HEAT repeats/Putative zinc-finger